MKISLVFPAFVTGLILAGGAGRAADWDGDQVNVQLLSPNPQTVAFNGNFIVPPPFNIEPFGEQIFPLGIGDTMVILQNLDQSADIFPSQSVIKITDLTASRIVGAVEDPNSTTILKTPVLFGSNFLQFDVSQQPLNPGSIKIDLNFSGGIGSPTPIPGPASLPLLASGLLGLLAVCWRKNTRGRRLLGSV